jgi:hypothetical protein
MSGYSSPERLSSGIASGARSARDDGRQVSEVARGNSRTLAHGGGGGGIPIVRDMPVPHLLQKQSLLFRIVVPVHVKGNGSSLVASDHFSHEVVPTVKMEPN